MKLEELKENLESYGERLKLEKENALLQGSKDIEEHLTIYFEGFSDGLQIALTEFISKIKEPFNNLLTELGLNDEEPSHLLDESFDI